MLRRSAQPPALRRHAHLPMARCRLRQRPAVDVRRRPARWPRPGDVVPHCRAARGTADRSRDRLPVLRGRDDVRRATVSGDVLVASTGSSSKCQKTGRK